MFYLLLSNKVEIVMIFNMLRGVCLIAFGFVMFVVSAAQPAHAGEKMIAITDDVSSGMGVIETSADDDVIEMVTDRPMVLKLDKDVSNILIGNDLYLNILPDSRRTLILMPVQPGATFFRAIDSDGNTIIEKRVIVAAKKRNYIRVKQACGEDDELCSFQSIYYCPDMCHTVYDYSNNERINTNEKIRSEDDKDSESSDGDKPEDLSDSSENQYQ